MANANNRGALGSIGPNIPTPTIELNRVMVVGCGNRVASDDAAGLEVASQLRRTAGHACEVREWNACLPGFLSEMSADSLVIFAGAVHRRMRPGTIYRTIFPAADGIPHLTESHFVCIPELRREMERMRKAAAQMPHIGLLGIEAERWDPGLGISSSVYATVMEVVRELARFKGQARLECPPDPYAPFTFF